MAGLLARGSLPCAAFPVAQWLKWRSALRLQLRGQPRHRAHALTAFPFNPRGEPSAPSSHLRFYGSITARKWIATQQPTPLLIVRLISGAATPTANAAAALVYVTMQKHLDLRLSRDRSPSGRNRKTLRCPVWRCWRRRRARSLRSVRQFLSWIAGLPPLQAQSRDARRAPMSQTISA